MGKTREQKGEDAITAKTGATSGRFSIIRGTPVSPPCLYHDIGLPFEMMTSVRPGLKQVDPY